MPSKREPPLVAALKEAIKAAGEEGESLAAIARETGVSHPQLSRFVRGERTLTLDSAAKLFDYFKMKVAT